MLKLKRQNAFTDEQQLESFIEVQCRTCHEYEPCGEWLKVQCYCCNSTGSFYYMHRLCFQRVNWCRVCQDPYNTVMKRPNATTTNSREEVQYSILKEISTKYQDKIMKCTVILVSLLLLYDLCKCITLDKVGQDELQSLTDAEYLWLPVRHPLSSSDNEMTHSFKLH